MIGQISGIGRQFVRAAMNAPFLEKEEEHCLAVGWKNENDKNALHKLTEAHMRLVVAIAMRYRLYGLPVADLFQEGVVGLMEAAARFEPSREVRFATYATWWIRASIQDYVLRNWSIVRGGTSSAQKSLFFNLRRLRAHLSQTQDVGGEQSLLVKIADVIGVSKSDVLWMNSRLTGGDVSLNAPNSDGEGGASGERGDFIVDDSPAIDKVVEEKVDSRRRSNWLKEAFSTLNERERLIVQERRLSDEGATLEVLGARLGISKERVRQIEERALSKLRAAIIGKDRQTAFQHA